MSEAEHGPETPEPPRMAGFRDALRARQEKEAKSTAETTDEQREIRRKNGTHIREVFPDEEAYVDEFLDVLSKAGMPGAADISDRYAQPAQRNWKGKEKKPAQAVKSVRGYVIGAKTVTKDDDGTQGEYPIYLCEDRTVRIAQGPAADQAHSGITQKLAAHLEDTTIVTGKFIEEGQKVVGFTEVPLHDLLLDIATDKMPASSQEG